MPRRKSINPQAVANLKALIDEKGLSLQKFADSLERRGYSTSPQNVHRYVTGENEIPASFANEVERVWGVNASWILGISPYKTPVDESAARLTERNDETWRRRTLFELLAQLSGWQVEPRPDIAAPFTGADEECDDTESAILRFRHYATVSHGEEVRDLDRVEFDKLLDRMLGIFDVEIRSL